jgi:UDP-N-acetylmuramate--alanine ligase
MYNIDFANPAHIHFIGIGGISMSGLAEILLSKGFTISGSDSKESTLTKKLENLGAHITYAQVTANITDNIDVVVYTAAISSDNAELNCVFAKNIPALTRAELLGQIMRNYDTPIAVSGTHGKTTTTSMISHVLIAGDLDPTISVGGILPAINGNIKVGKSANFITEACEYTNSFLEFHPKISIILNIDADHLDFFKDLDDIRNSFRLFAQRLPLDGTLIINGDIPNYAEIVDGLPCEVITYALDNSGDYTANNISFDEKGLPTFDCISKGLLVGTFSLNVPGLHNISNALSAIALGRKLKLSIETIQQGFLNFVGTDRRFQYKGEIAGVTIIDDYAHHPTEITATLTSARNYPHETIWCVFQPHTYTRTHALLADFAKALTLADKVILCDIYAARERNTIGITSEVLKERIEELGTDCYYFPSFDEIENFLLENCIHGDLLITMGAGDVVKIGEHLLGE